MILQNAQVGEAGVRNYMNSLNLQFVAGAIPKSKYREPVHIVSLHMHVVLLLT